MRVHEIIADAGRRSRRMSVDRRATAAAEFALVFPLAVVLMMGLIAVGEALAISRKVTITTRTVTDLITQSSSVKVSDISTALNASSAIAAPFSTANMTIVVSQISTDAAGKASVSWSRALNGTALTSIDKVTLPASMTQPNISLIWGQVSYNYTPFFGARLTGSFTLRDQIYMAPRVSNSITCSDCAN